jgi:16S rRNA (guanine966-N2)-methyltransferase
VRVIGGELRGRRLEAPDGIATRPMLDRVRESLFATLGPWIPGANVLDLFAGSGSLGIEALSRGARRARFVERSPRALDCLRANLSALDLGEKAHVVRGNALAEETWGDEPFDVVLFDSPYPLLREKRDRDAIFRAIERLAREHLAPEGVLVFHGPHRGVFAFEFPRDLVLRERAYGTNALWYVQRDEPVETLREQPDPDGAR